LEKEWEKQRGKAVGHMEHDDDCCHWGTMTPPT
jgi:hypothetical protein